MKEEMRKLNRVKYAHSEEEKKKLASEGYRPVRTAGPDSSQTADPDNGQPAGPDSSQNAEPDNGQPAGPDNSQPTSVDKTRKPDKRGTNKK